MVPVELLKGLYAWEFSLCQPAVNLALELGRSLLRQQALQELLM